jgi:hypothetical protein
MAQINVSYDDRLVAGIDRVAAARRLSRADLLRAVAEEVVEAHDAGRLAFHSDDGPRIDTSLNLLVIQLREAVVELDRSQRANQRIERKLIDAWNGGEAAARVAEQHILEQVTRTHLDGYQPFQDEVDALREAFSAAPANVAAQIEAKLIGIDGKLEAVRELASKPAVQHNLILGDDRVLSLRFLSVCAAMVGVVSTLSFLLLAGQVQPLAVPVANRLIADDEHVCRMINRRYGVSDCMVPKGQRQAALREIKAADQ